MNIKKYIARSHPKSKAQFYPSFKFLPGGSEIMAKRDPHVAPVPTKFTVRFLSGRLMRYFTDGSLRHASQGQTRTW